jgi:hypothetical protein
MGQADYPDGLCSCKWQLTAELAARWFNRLAPGLWGAAVHFLTRASLCRYDPRLSFGFAPVLKIAGLLNLAIHDYVDPLSRNWFTPPFENR